MARKTINPRRRLMGLSDASGESEFLSPDILSGTWIREDPVFVWPDASVDVGEEPAFVRLAATYLFVRHACLMEIPPPEQIAPAVLGYRLLAGENSPTLKELLGCRCAVAHVPLLSPSADARLVRRYLVNGVGYWPQGLAPDGRSYELADALMRELMRDTTSADRRNFLSGWIVTGTCDRSGVVGSVSIGNKADLLKMYPKFNWIVPEEDLWQFERCEGVGRVTGVRKLETALRKVADGATARRQLLLAVGQGNVGVVEALKGALPQSGAWRDNAELRERFLQAAASCRSEKIKKMLFDRGLYDAMLTEDFPEALQDDLQREFNK